MDNFLLRGLATTLALTMALAACSRGGDRGLNQDEQAKLDGIAAREAEVASKAADLEKRTLELQSQSSELDAQKQQLEADKAAFNVQADQLDIERAQVADIQAALAAEKADLAAKQQLTAAEQKRLEEITAKQAELSKNLSKREVEVGNLATEIGNRQISINQTQEELKAQIENQRAELAAAQAMLQSEGRLAKLLGGLSSTTPSQIIVLVTGTDCSGDGPAAIKRAVNDADVKNSAISTELYNVNPCGARHMITVNSAKKLSEIETVAIKNNFLVSIIPIDKLIVKSFLTITDSKGGNTQKRQVYKSPIINIRAVMSRIQLENVNNYSELPQQCHSVVNSACLKALNKTMNAETKADLTKAFVVSKDDRTADKNLARFSSTSIAAKLTLSHEIYAVGPDKESIKLPRTPVGFVDTETSASTLYFSLPVAGTPVVTDLKAMVNTSEAKASYILEMENIISALKYTK